MFAIRQYGYVGNPHLSSTLGVSGIFDDRLPGIPDAAGDGIDSQEKLCQQDFFVFATR